MNTILISKDDIYKLAKYEVKDETLLGLIDTGFMFDKFLVKLGKGDLVYKVKIDEDWNYTVIRILNGSDLNRKEVIKEVHNLLDDVYEIGNKEMEEFKEKFKNDENVKVKVSLGTAEFIMKIMCYIMDEEFHKEVLYKESIEHKNVITEISNDVRKKVDNKTYSLSDIIRYVGACKSGRHNNITCECWSVRGHYRHYKNGKVVFIKSYNKGVNRDIKPENKTYTI